VKNVHKRSYIACFHLYEISRIIHTDRTQTGGCQGMGEGGGSNCLMGIGFSFRNENVLELDGGDGCPALQTY